MPLLPLVAGIDWRYFLAGGTACSFSHGVSVPFDVIKTRIQLDPELKSLGFKGNFDNIMEKEGVGAFSKGLVQTLSGYAIQGSLKYGLYNDFKPLVAGVFVHTNSFPMLLLSYAISSAAAELVGSLALTPFEVSRIRAIAIASPSDLPSKPVVITNADSGSIRRDIARGFPALIAKQIPYTVVQLVSFELLTAALYSTLNDQGMDTTVSSTKFAITFFSAVIAGILSSTASQPGDVILSITNKSRKNENTALPSVLQIVTELFEVEGVQGFFKGYQARLVHVCVIVVSQLLVYDSVKQFFGIAATGSQ
jgi:solute carrier family 25 phosphate transporter 3